MKQQGYNDVLSALATKQELNLTVSGKIISYDATNRKFLVEVQTNWKDEKIILAEMPFEEFSFQNVILTNSRGELTIDAVKAKGLKFEANVMEVSSKKIIISRKRAQEEATKKMKCGKYVSATIVSVCPYAVFCDIGNGIIAMNHISELSKIFYNCISKWVSVGDTYMAKITSIDGTKFTISRKEYYDDISKYSEYSVGQVVECRVGRRVENIFSPGYVLEITPGFNGIMDTGRFYEEGEVIRAVIKKFDDKHRARLIKMSD